MAQDVQPTKLPSYLLPDRQIHVVISTRSGSGGASEYFTSTLQPVLETHSLTYSVHSTTSASSIIELISSNIIIAATKGSKQTILLLSGDGGPADFVNTISTLLMRDTYDSRVGSVFVKPVIVLFPLGTANALAWSSGIAQDPIHTMLHGQARPLPQFQASFSIGSTLVTNEGQDREDVGSNYDDNAAMLYGAVVFSWGLHASLVSMSDTVEYRQHGVKRFKMAAGKLLEEAHQYKAHIKIRRSRYSDWEDLVYQRSQDAEATETSASHPTNTHAYILTTLVSNLEETFCISPSSSTSTSTNPYKLSQKLRLVAIHPPQPPSTTGKEMTRILTLAYQDGAHISDPSVMYEEIDGLRIEFEESDPMWRRICVDGKIIEVGTEEAGGKAWAEISMLPAVGMDGRRVVELVVPA